MKKTKNTYNLKTNKHKSQLKRNHIFIKYDIYELQLNASFQTPAIEWTKSIDRSLGWYFNNYTKTIGV
jgi:hypothetical protein